MIFIQFLLCLLLSCPFAVTIHADVSEEPFTTSDWFNFEETHFEPYQQTTPKVNNFYRRPIPSTQTTTKPTPITYVTRSYRKEFKKRVTQPKIRFKLDCTNPKLSTSYLCIGRKFKQNPQYCSTRAGNPSALSYKLPASLLRECSRLVTCQVNAEAVALGAKLEKLADCLQCGVGGIDVELEGCHSTRPGFKSWNDQCDDPKTNPVKVVQCRNFRPNCNDPKYARHNLCLNCSVTNPDPKCRNIDCKLGGKDRGLDICEHYTFDCKDPQFRDEDACLDCNHLDKDLEKCKNRKCYKGQPDAGQDICMTWQPDCNILQHKSEDLCLDCRSDNSEDCKRSDGSEWDCHGVDAHQPICYYSTTSTKRPTTKSQLGGRRMGMMDLPDILNTSNEPVTVVRRRNDYLTSTAVPTFIIVSVSAAVLFILMHMPKCCFGIFQEPNWELYALPREESDDEKLDYGP